MSYYVQVKMEKHRKTIKVLSALSQTDAKTVKVFVKVAPTELIRSISEICFNVLHGSFPLTTAELKSLRKHKSAIYKLSSKSVRQNIKRGHITLHLIKTLVSIWPGDTH